MTSDQAGDRELAAYRDKLLTALRLREVPGERIGEVLAEVEAHVAETGEDPREAFGTPREYAEQVRRATGGRRPWSLSGPTALSSAFIGVGAFVATSLTIGGVVDLLGDGGERFGLGPTGRLVLGLLLAALVITYLVRYTLRVDDPVVDPRTGEAQQPVAAWLPPVLFTGLFVVMVVVTVVVERLAP